MPKPKREETGSHSNYERHKLQRLYTQGGAAYGSVRNLVKANNLPVSMVRLLLPSITSCRKFALTTRKFNKMKAFARFKIEFWCMDLAYVDKTAENKNCVKYLPVRQDLFDRTVDAEEMKTKDSKETVCVFLYMFTKKKGLSKFWTGKGKEFIGDFKKPITS